MPVAYGLSVTGPPGLSVETSSRNSDMLRSGMQMCSCDTAKIPLDRPLSTNAALSA